MSDAQEEKAPQDATDPELLNKIHAALIMILRELDAACEQLGISYVVCGGTAIGAARHKGFSSRSEERRVGKECRSRWSPYH